MEIGSFLDARLAARGESLTAFDERCIPGGCVAPLSNTAGILGRRALPAGCLAPLGATPDSHHGLLAAFAIVSCAHVATAQNIGATLQGLIVDEQHAVLPGVSVTITNIETGIARIIERTCQLMKEAGFSEDVRALGGIDLPTLQKHVNLWFSLSLDLRIEEGQVVRLSGREEEAEVALGVAAGAQDHGAGQGGRLDRHEVPAPRGEDRLG